MSFHRYTPIQMSRLGLKLKPVFIGQLLSVPTLKNPAFSYKNNQFEVVIKADTGITSHFIREYAQTNGTEIFVYKEDYENINHHIKEELTRLTRSLSIGDPEKNAIKHSNFLSMQMENLYKDPFNDELLTHQFQNTKNLGSLLIQNKDIHKNLFKSIKRGHYHYTLTQPLLSSILLLSFIQSLKVFNDNEIESLFLTSYFKDIGMSFIPREKFELAHLSDFDKNLFSQHAEQSMRILDGRVPFNQNQLNLIKNHHFLNYNIQCLATGRIPEVNPHIISGIGSTFLSGIDVFIAMTAQRPYRKEVSSFQALDILKDVLSEDFPHEFRSLVIFIKNFKPF